MEGKEKRGCSFEGKNHSNGEQICIADKCMSCDDGIWEITQIRKSGAED